MVALCLDDLEGRPTMNPWLAGLYIDPPYRNRGYALRLIEELETRARKGGLERLFLYTAGAAGLYSKAGWTTIETFEKQGRAFSVMQRRL